MPLVTPPDTAKLVQLLPVVNTQLQFLLFMSYPCIGCSWFGFQLHILVTWRLCAGDPPTSVGAGAVALSTLEQASPCVGRPPF